MTTRAGFVAIIGAPNAGKSTLLNAVLGHKVAIVTPKAQTTRSNVRGILTRDDSQFIFVDTPGIHQSKQNLNRAMVDVAWRAHIDADFSLLLVDAKRGFTEPVMELIDELKNTKKPVFLAFNKIDGIKRDDLLPLLAQASEMNLFKEVFLISALKEDGVADVLKELEKYLPEGPFLYDKDALTDISDRLMAAEITREKAFLLLGEELPYSLMVQTEGYEERADGSVKIDQVLLIERDSQKKIVIGKGGHKLKAIGQRARQELESLFDRRVHLFLRVKVRPEWSKDPYVLEDMGLNDDGK